MFRWRISEFVVFGRISEYNCLNLVYSSYFRMESSGKPEQVHISEETASFLGEAYYLDEGEEVFGEY